MVSREDLAVRRDAIRHCIERQKLTNLQTRDFIVRQFFESKPDDYPLRTFYYDLEAIQKENLDWLAELRKQGMLDYYRATLASLDERKRQLAVIAASETANDFAKIAANKAIADIEVYTVNLMGYVSSIANFTLKNRLPEGVQPEGSQPSETR